MTKEYILFSNGQGKKSTIEHDQEKKIFNIFNFLLKVRFDFESF
jgi:hypothetical protein